MTAEEQEAFAAATGATIDAASVNLDDLAAAYAKARADREEASDREKGLRVLEDQAQAELFNAMEARNLKSIRHRTLGTFTLNDLAWPSVVDGDALRAWALEVEPGILVTNSQRLGKVMRDAMKGEGEMPPGIEAVFTRKIKWTRTT
jgi:hypothetical protein